MVSNRKLEVEELAQGPKPRSLAALRLGHWLALMCLTAALLTAAGVAAVPATAQSNTAAQSRCATVDVLEHVVEVGETITAEASRGSGWTQTCGPSWGWGPALPVGKILAGCGETDKFCKIETSRTTGNDYTGYYFSAFCIQNVGGPEWESCDVYSVVPKGALIEGYARSPQGVPVPGVKVEASGPAGSGSGITSSNGEYVLVVKPGTYKVAPVYVEGPTGEPGAKAGFEPASESRRAVSGGVSTSNFVVVQQDTLSIQFDPAQVVATGLGTVQVTITDTAPATYGASAPAPVAGARIVVEPPVEVGTDGVASGLLCDTANNLVSPVRLHDGSLLGRHFTATTDSAGQVVLTLYVGAVGGSWRVDAYQPGPGGAPLVSEALDVAPPAAGRTTLDPDGDLPSQLTSAADGALLQKGQSLQRTVLEWLGEIDPQLQSVNLGVGYMPIYRVDTGGAINPGVIIFDPTASVRSDVLNYLDGLVAAVPPESQALVIDIGKLATLMAAGKYVGGAIHDIQDVLTSLQAWETGEEGDHAHFGLVGATGNEDMLYGYGPYLPAPSSSPAAVALGRCIGA